VHGFAQEWRCETPGNTKQTRAMCREASRRDPKLFAQESMGRSLCPPEFHATAESRGSRRATDDSMPRCGQLGINSTDGTRHREHLLALRRNWLREVKQRPAGRSPTLALVAALLPPCFVKMMSEMRSSPSTRRCTRTNASQNSVVMAVIVACHAFCNR